MVYWTLRLAVICILNLFYTLKVEGLENLPDRTNFILVANHSSFLDPLVLMAGIPKKIYCIAMKNLFAVAAIRWFLLMAKALPDGSSSEKALRLLVNNRYVGLFPEGGISRNGTLKEFRRGAALLAVRSGRPIVPCAILGTYEVLPRIAKFPKLFRPIKMKIGRPIFLLKEYEEVVDDIILQEGTAKIRNTIKEMIYAG